jgi:pyridoxal 5'-phosphate synthase pdxT subunit
MVSAQRASVAGLLALQGDFEKHKSMLISMDAEVREVRIPEQLETIDALIIPGGESTTMTRLITDEMRAGLVAFASSHPTWGTCAGMIMLSKTTDDPRVRPLGLVDIQVERMGFGRQVHSFEGTLKLSQKLRDPERSFNGFFIRAPRVRQASSELEVLAWLNGEPVALRKGNLLLTSFHPELTDDNRFHEYFLSMLG